MQRNNKIEEDIKEDLDKVLSKLGTELRFEGKYYQEYDVWECNIGPLNLDTIVKAKYGVQMRISIDYGFQYLRISICDYPYSLETQIKLQDYNRENFTLFIQKCISNYTDIMNFMGSK